LIFKISRSSKYRSTPSKGTCLLLIASYNRQAYPPPASIVMRLNNKGTLMLRLIVRSLAPLLACLFALPAAAQTTAPAKPATAVAATNPARQAQPSADEMRHMMDATMGAMLPMMGRMAEVMIETQLRIAEKPETADKIARFKKNLYDSLLKGGFTQQQAMEITVSTAIPSAMVPGK
jgi:hypothetical protein